MSVRIAIVGLGYWGPNLARIFAEIPGSELALLVDARPERLEWASRHHPGVPPVSSLDEALARDVDAFVLATPAETHAELGLRILDAGRPLFVEKPLALSADDAERLAAKAAEKNLVLMVGHLLLYHPAYLEAVRRLRAGEFGTLRYLYSRRVNLGIVRAQENALWSLAPHDIAVSDWIVGAAPVEAHAVGQCYLQPGIEDVVFYTLRYPNGVLFHGHVSWLDPQKVRELSIIGTERMAVIDDAQASEKLRIYNRNVETQRQPFRSYGQYLAIRTGDILLPQVSSSEPLREEALHFVACVRDGTRPRSDGASGVAVVRALNALARSLQSGGWVTIR